MQLLCSSRPGISACCGLLNQTLVIYTLLSSVLSWQPESGAAGRTVTVLVFTGACLLRTKLYASTKPSVSISVYVSEERVELLIPALKAVILMLVICLNLISLLGRGSLTISRLISLGFLIL